HRAGPAPRPPRSALRRPRARFRRPDARPDAMLSPTDRRPRRSRRLLLLPLLPILAMAASAGSARGQDEPRADRPNILVLFTDDWRWDTLGYAGNRVVRTPNLDALAARGAWFRQSRVTTSICWVSRAS